MQPYRIPIWKSSPFCRLIIPFIGGILLQWYLDFAIKFLLLLLFSCFMVFCSFYFLPIVKRFVWQQVQGVLLFFMLMMAGMYLTWQKDLRHQQHWYGDIYHDSSSLLIRITEPPTEKAKSIKVTADVEAVINQNVFTSVTGKLFVYFEKDSTVPSFKYGDRILINATLSPLKNSGNPGAFNYQRYGAFQQVYHTAYVKKQNRILLDGDGSNFMYRFIYKLQSATLETLSKYISGDRNIIGIAEALLIGYKEDLDKDLVQAYSNAGVVHIIAISGLHLGLIYWLLAWLFDRMPLVKRKPMVKLFFILAFLWLFSLLTGASPSVLRSAVMFTCMLIGKQFFKQSSVYNTLAASAFLLLCYNPYYCWDVGFQLSYLAIIGIIALQKPIGNLVFSKYAWVNKVWMMLAVTIAAQVATFPVCLFYFHQFPTLFFITNLIAVPLSTIILFAEMILLAISWIHPLAIITGKIIAWMIGLMNYIMLFCDRISWSLWDGIPANLLTTILLYLFIICVCSWLILQQKRYYKLALFCLIGFSGAHAWLKWNSAHQKKIIIYNIPQKQAIDFIAGKQFCFAGDSSLQIAGMLQNFHLKPSRVTYQVTESKYKLQALYQYSLGWIFFGKKILQVNGPTRFNSITEKIPVDILLISNNPTIKISQLITAVRPTITIFDASNSLWKIEGWKKECSALALPCFSIPDQGAFILDIE